MKGLHVLSWSIAGCLTGGQEMEPWQKTQLSDLFEDGRPELPLQVDVTETQATAA